MPSGNAREKSCQNDGRMKGVVSRHRAIKPSLSTFPQRQLLTLCAVNAASFILGRVTAAIPSSWQDKETRSVAQVSTPPLISKSLTKRRLHLSCERWLFKLSQTSTPLDN